jgi:hypothetical protein
MEEKTVNFPRTAQRMRVGLLSIVPLIGLLSIAQAQTTHKKNIIKRHPMASSIIAGAAAHHYAKKRSHGMMHKHPIATGVAAAAITHHYAKKK